MQPQRSSKDRRPPSKRPLKKKLEGKSFYLDNVKKQQIILLSETIHALGGRVESFLHKDVDYVVTGSKEDLKHESPPATKGAVRDEAEGEKRQTKWQERGATGDKRPGTPRLTACGSRGKALLEKAIRNKERLQASSVLSSARSWGVKILAVDHALIYLKRLTKERSTGKPCAHAVKTTVLNIPHLKIEDVSRKYKPLFTLYASFPALCRLSKNPLLQSPPPPPWFKEWTEQGENISRKKKTESSKFQTSLNVPWLIGKKNTSYCECCQQVFTSLKEHLLSDQHHRYAMDQSNYSAVDQVVAGMLPAFDSASFRESEETVNGLPMPVDDFCDVDLHVAGSQQDEPEFFLDSLSARPPSRSPPSPSLGVPSTGPENDDVAAGRNSSTPRTHPQLAVQPSHVSSSGLNIQASPSRPSQHFPPCSPPVLSSEIPFPCFVPDPHSSYSDPPILSPQCYAAEAAAVEESCEERFFNMVSELTAALTAPSSTKRRLANGGSCCVPRNPATPPNPKKRRHSAGEPSSRKRRRRSLSGSARGVPDSSRRQSADLGDAGPSDSLLGDLDIPDSQQTSRTSPRNHMDSLALPSPRAVIHPPLDFTSSQIHKLVHHDNSHARAASICIERSLIPDPAGLSSSDSEWDCGLLSRLGPTAAVCLTPPGPNRELDIELLHRPCPWTHDNGYESHLHTILQQAAPCGDEADVCAFSRSAAQIAEVQ